MSSTQKKILFIEVLFGIFVFSIIYAYTKFVWKEDKIEKVILSLNKSYEEASPILYIMNNDGVGFDFSSPYYAKTSPNSTQIVFDLEEPKELRKIRIYFEKKVDNLIISKLVFEHESANFNVQLEELLLRDRLIILENKTGLLEVNVQAPNGYLETPNHYFYPSDQKSLIITIIGVLGSLVMLFFLFNRFVILQDIRFSGLSELSVVIFLCSIFLPHPIFNITLILSLLIVIRNFNLKRFLLEKINLFFIFYFLVLFLNDLFISESGFHSLKPTETYLPLLILPVYISSIRTSKGLVIFPVSAIILGVVMFLTSLVDVFVFKNINYFSFDEFAKFTHPVYYSYLSSFSIFYVFLYSRKERFYKNLIQGILFFFLILAGSKLVITLTFLIYASLIIRNKKAVIIMAVGLIVLALFPPVQNRFNEILNIDDLSVVNEKVIADQNDPRVNGLTLRLLLWQESLHVVKTVPEIIFGKGVGKSTDDLLKLNLVKRGLGKYQRFSTHNQFVNIFMRAGLVGVFSLLMIIIFGFYQAIKNKNKMLLIMVIMFTFAMLTESVFQRVLGIYFFTTVLLFLMKPNFLNETSVSNSSKL